MEWGKPVFARRGCAVLWAIAFIPCVGLSVGAQQKPSDSTPTQSTVLAAPDAQPTSRTSTDSGRSNSNAGPNSEKSGHGAAELGIKQDSSLLRLGPGDLVELSVYNVPELTTKARISSSGDVYLPLIDYVHLAELTVEEAQTLLEKRLADGGFVRNPHVTIFLDESASQGVTMLGEVSKPGIYPVIGDRKLYDVLSEAGGFSPSAGRKVSIIRHNQPQAITVNLPRNLADDMQDNIQILPGDTITIPRAPIIYVVGDVGRPSGLQVTDGSLTVLQAVALAGGINKTAKTSGVRIIRKGTAGMTETEVPIKKMLEAKAPDIALQGDDILFVPVSGRKMMTARTLEAAMSMATSVSIYAVHP